jgi:hypothetical protein
LFAAPRSTASPLFVSSNNNSGGGFASPDCTARRAPAYSPSLQRALIDLTPLTDAAAAPSPGTPRRDPHASPGSERRPPQQRHWAASWRHMTQAQGVQLRSPGLAAASPPLHPQPLAPPQSPRAVKREYAAMAADADDAAGVPSPLLPQWLLQRRHYPARRRSPTDRHGGGASPP